MHFPLLVILLHIFNPALCHFASGSHLRYNDVTATPDSLYFVARDYALKGETIKARNIAAGLLENNPLYHDAAILIARTYAWEDEFDTARNYINDVLLHQPDYYDALTLLTDVEIWDGNYSRAIQTADSALLYYPDEPELLLRKARALFLEGSEEEARSIIQKILEVDPGNEEASELLRQIDTPGFYYYRVNNYLLAGYYGEYFDAPYNRHFHMGSVGYSYYTGAGPVTAKINFANTFIDGTGLTRYPSLQYELEAYPRLSRESYLLLNYAFSKGDVFPLHRSAVEYFRALPHGFEVSAGIRHMYWDDHYLFFTGSAGVYYGDMWFSLRPYFFPLDDQISASWYIFARRYFGHADSFAGIILGYGISPDETFAELPERIYLRSTSIGFEFSRGISGSYVLRGGLRYKNEEYVTGSSRNYWYLNIGIRYILTGR